MLPIIGICAGVALLVLPIALDLRENWANQQAITTMSDTADLSQEPQHGYYLKQARAYNRVLAGLKTSIPVDRILPYDEQLGAKEEAVVSWVEAPKAGIKLPVYLGTSDAVLSSGVGHVSWSSLPVGGKSTHCVLTGHSGMYNSRMFDDIRRLEPGDLFALHTLGDECVYEVSDIRTVLPDELDSLQIERGEDLCTLMTCTPYGVNDHRLLVTGKRTDRELEPATPLDALVNYLTNGRVLPLWLGIAILILGLIAYLLLRRRRRKRLEARRLIGTDERDGE